MPITMLSSAGTNTNLGAAPMRTWRTRPMRTTSGANAFDVVSSGDELITALARKTFDVLTAPTARVSTLILEYTNTELSVTCRRYAGTPLVAASSVIVPSKPAPGSPWGVTVRKTGTDHTFIIEAPPTKLPK